MQKPFEIDHATLNRLVTYAQQTEQTVDDLTELQGDDQRYRRRYTT